MLIKDIYMTHKEIEDIINKTNNEFKEINLKADYTIHTHQGIVIKK